MPDFRSYAAHAGAEPSEIVLSPDESHHLVRVNRARAGDPVVVFDGRGREWRCECVDADRRAARLRVISREHVPPLPYSIALAQALPKGKTFEAILRKATEIGATAVIPLATERTEVRLDDARRESKHDKWAAAVIEAGKQSGNSYLPEVAAVRSMEEFLQESGGYDLKLIASLQPGATSLRPVLQKRLEEKQGARAKAICLIGPEGDFSPGETEAAIAAGFAPITLGRTVLRCETAAIYALSILSYELAEASGAVPDTNL